MFRRSIRLELTILYAIVMALTLGAVGLAIERLAYNRISASIDASLRRSARAVISTVDELLLLGVPLDDLPLSASFSVLNPPPWPPRYVQLTDSTGKVVLRSGNLGTSRLPVDTMFIRRSDSEMKISPDMKLHMYRSRRTDNGSIPIETLEIMLAEDEAPDFSGMTLYRSESIRMITFRLRPIEGRHVGWGQVAISLHELDRAREKTRLALAFIIPSAMALSALAGWWMAGRLLRPIDSITKTAQRISAESLNARLEPRNASDELSRLVETLNDLLERLEKNFTQVKRFSSDVSHELRTPLTIIQGESEVVLRPDTTREEMRASLEVIQDEAQSMSQLVKNLLALSRMETKQERGRMAPVEFSPVVADLAEQADALGEGKGLNVSAAIEPGIWVAGDAAMLHQMGYNLVQNAVKYTPHGGRIAVALSKTVGATRLKVTDTGIGIEPEEIEHIFDRFYRGDKVRNHSDGGTGLGLALVKQIVEIHEGSIDVQSVSGKGTAFVVELPTIPGPQPDRGAGDAPAPSEGNTA